MRPSPEFNYVSARTKLVNLHVKSSHGRDINYVTPGDVDNGLGYGDEYGEAGLGNRGKLLRISAWIDLDSHVAIGCAGAILTYLQRRRSIDYLPGDEDAYIAFCVKSMEMFSLQGTMLV